MIRTDGHPTICNSRRVDPRRKADCKRRYYAAQRERVRAALRARQK